MSAGNVGPTFVHAGWIASTDVTDADPITIVGYSHQGKLMAPVKAYTTWRVTPGIPGVWTFEKLRVTGYVLRKNGTPGSVAAEMEWREPSKYMSSFYGAVEDAPEWARTWMESVVLPAIPGSDVA